MMDDFDELDRALFALPLENPPPGLRESILRATIEAPVAQPFMGGWETAILGIVLAVATWLAVVVWQDAAVARVLSNGLGSVAGMLARPMVLAWSAAGFSVAATLLLAGLPARTNRTRNA